MAKSLTFSASLVITGDGHPTTSPAYIPATMPVTNAAAPYGGEVPQVLAGGANTITVPTGAIGVWILPPAGSVIIKTLKGIAADTGIVIHAVNPTVLYLAASQATFVINASGAGETISLQWL